MKAFVYYVCLCSFLSKWALNEIYNKHKKKQHTWEKLLTTILATIEQKICSEIASKNLHTRYWKFTYNFIYFIKSVYDFGVKNLSANRWPKKNIFCEYYQKIATNAKDIHLQIMLHTNIKVLTSEDGCWRCNQLLMMRN